MTENTFLIILGALLTALQLGIGAFLMSLLKRIGAVEKKADGITNNYLNKFAEVNKNLGNMEVSIVRELNSSIGSLAEQFSNTVDRLTERIDTAVISFIKQKKE